MTEDFPDQALITHDAASQQALTTWNDNAYINAATSSNTRKAYRSDIRHFEKWGGKLPASAEQIVRYLEAHAATLNPRTQARRLIALRHWHVYQGFADPTLHPALQKTMAGIVRIHGKPKEKARAVTPEEIATIARYLSQENSYAALRDNALLQIGFFGALRRSELVAIYYEHITWRESGIDILLPSSKTDQSHQGQYSAIPYHRSHALCPVRALEVWLNVSGIKSGPIFRRIHAADQLGTTAMTPLAINQILKKRSIEAGLSNTDSLSSHSLRRGLATSAARAGAPLQAIMRAGRWKQTNTVMEYIEASERMTDNAAMHVLDSYDNQPHD